MKKKIRRADIPNGVRNSEFEDLLSTIGPDHLKGRIGNATRDVLDRWVEEIAGQKPNDTHDNEFVAASLCRYIDGDKNWGDDPKRVEYLNGKKTTVTTEEGNPSNQEHETHTQAETPEGEEIMKKNGKTAVKTPAKKNVKKAAKSVIPKASPPAMEKATKKEGGTPTLFALGERMPKKLFSTYKGRELEAHVQPDGHIVTSEGKFTSPSSAANAFADKTQDGWLFWKYIDAEGKRRTISGLRKK